MTSRCWLALGPTSARSSGGRTVETMEDIAQTPEFQALAASIDALNTALAAYTDGGEIVDIYGYDRTLGEAEPQIREQAEALVERVRSGGPTGGSAAS